MTFKVAQCGVHTAKALSALPNLRKIDLSHSLHSEPGRMLKHIMRSSTLQELDLSYNGNLTETAVRQAVTGSKARAVSMLTRLVLAHCRLLGDACLESIGGCWRLVELNLRGLPIGNTGVAELGRLANLRVLDVTGCWSVTSVGLIDLMHRSEALQRLSLARTGVNVRGLLDAAQILELSFFDIRCVSCAAQSCGCVAADTSLSNTGFFNLERLAPVLVRFQRRTLEVLRISSPTVTAESLVQLGDLEALRNLDISFCSEGTPEALSLMLMKLTCLRPFFNLLCLLCWQPLTLHLCLSLSLTHPHPHSLAQGRSSSVACRRR